MNDVEYVILESDTRSNIALLFMPLASHRYCIAHDFDRKKRSWSHGAYTDKLDRAAKGYKDSIRAAKNKSI